MDIKKRQKNAENFKCDLCDFNCFKQSDWERHITRPKHQNNEKRYKMIPGYDTKTPENAINPFQCECGKIYKYSSGLWRHKKICDNNTICIINDKENSIQDEVNNNSNLILELIKQNDEFKYLLLEQNNKLMNICENSNGSINTNIINTNSNNKTFNLNMFLNEECKDAMNLTDFVDSLQFQLSDLEKVGELGYVNGLSNFIIRNLKALDIHKRPVHCSDAKRETIFIKEADKWEKENDEKDKLHKAIKTIANKNIRLIPKWREKYPECAHSDSCKSDQYNNIIIHSLDTNINSNPKIIKNIAKEVKIEKGN